MISTKFKTVDEYLAAQAPASRKILVELRAIIKSAAPKAEEVISYNMPAFKQHGVLVYYAGNKNHTGFYPTGGPIKVFTKELETYTTSKGAIQFPHDRPIPVSLVKKIVKLRIKEDKEREALKTTRKKSAK
ncbi:MAG: DUF1801 domain-containing protein [Ferruginibacter sp.]